MQYVLSQTSTRQWPFSLQENLALEAEIPENRSDIFAFLFPCFLGTFTWVLRRALTVYCKLLCWVCLTQLSMSISTRKINPRNSEHWAWTQKLFMWLKWPTNVQLMTLSIINHLKAVIYRRLYCTIQNHTYILENHNIWFKRTPGTE